VLDVFGSVGVTEQPIMSDAVSDLHMQKVLIYRAFWQWSLAQPPFQPPKIRSANSVERRQIEPVRGVRECGVSKCPFSPGERMCASGCKPARGLDRVGRFGALGARIRTEQRALVVNDRADELVADDEIKDVTDQTVGASATRERFLAEGSDNAALDFDLTEFMLLPLRGYQHDVAVELFLGTHRAAPAEQEGAAKVP
jgi:hypothetical protein